MGLMRLYQRFVGLYPRDYRISFSAEMLNTFGSAAEERRGRGAALFTRFVVAELACVVKGAGLEWMAKLGADSSIRGRYLPDVRRMRPTGVPREMWFAGSGLSARESHVRNEDAAQRRAAG